MTKLIATPNGASRSTVDDVMMRRGRIMHPNGQSMSAPLVLRRAEHEDGHDLLAWRNDPDSIRNSKSARPVSPDEHARWLAANLVNPDCRIYVGVIEAQKIGMVRFDRVAHRAETFRVSIALNPACRGQRLGTQLLRASLQDAAPGRFEAEIKPDNVISRKLFEASGFRRIGPSPAAGLDLYRVDIPGH